MPSSIHARHSGSARIRSQVARVSADSGLIVALPHNLYQIARRTLPVRSGAKPGAVEQREQARRPLAGFPTRLADDQLVGMLDDDPLRRRRGGRTRGRRSRRSARTAMLRRSSRPDRPTGSCPPSTNHHGTPLSIGTMIVSGSDQRRRGFGGRRSAGRLDRDDQQIGGSVEARERAVPRSSPFSLSSMPGRAAPAGRAPSPVRRRAPASPPPSRRSRRHRQRKCSWRAAMGYDAPPGKGLPMIFRQLFEPKSSAYTYLVACEDTREAVLIDPVLETVERDLALAQRARPDAQIHARNAHPRRPCDRRRLGSAMRPDRRRGCRRRAAPITSMLPFAKGSRSTVGDA